MDDVFFFAFDTEYGSVFSGAVFVQEYTASNGKTMYTYKIPELGLTDQYVYDMQFGKPQEYDKYVFALGRSVIEAASCLRKEIVEQIKYAQVQIAGFNEQIDQLSEVVSSIDRADD